jgi:fido (protein-threonine AMPylation protein)
VRVRQLLDDTKTQIKHKTYPEDELAIRFHHQLVLIHPFPNGNGRHARLMTDLLALKLGQPRFTWGSQLGDSLGAPGKSGRPTSKPCVTPTRARLKPC